MYGGQVCILRPADAEFVGDPKATGHQRSEYEKPPAGCAAVIPVLTI